MPKLIESDVLSEEEENSETEGSSGSGTGTGTGTGSGSGEDEGTGSGEEGTGTGTGTGDDEGTGEEGSGSGEEGSGEEGSGTGTGDDEGTGSASESDPKAAKKKSTKPDPVASKKEMSKDDSKKKTEGSADKGAPKNGEKTGGPMKAKLWKKGASGRKKTEERIFVLEGTTLNYYTSEDNVITKKSKKIELKNAKIASGKEEKGTKYWITITTAQKKKREIAAKSKEDFDLWFAALKVVAEGDEKPTEDKPAVIAPNPLAKDAKPKKDDKKRP